MPSIFLAHSSKDKPFARRLAQALREQGFRVWLDEAELLVGDSLSDKIGKAIMKMDFLGAILSPNAVQILQMIVVDVPAEHGAILLWDGAPDEFSSQVRWDKSDEVSVPNRSIQVSRTVLRRVASNSTALLVNNVSADENLSIRIATYSAG